ncbi:MAG: TraB/GumN family protein [Sphingobium sp.]|uniref:TraB/GumN family protein n=1 Tax=Sphingobium sp. TaxID=1912891 RepID=UPI0029AEB294|nr:TraB/GumN family protein [Sphingobium sp.]MDX3908771.1 TraB/GumN family protein [Sphingobium sp.]
MHKPIMAIFGLALLLLGACTGERPSKEEPGGPALWRVEKSGKQAFIFGTIHVLPDDVKWETAALRDAVAAADRLVLEAEGLDDAKGTQQIFDRLGRTPNLPSLGSRVPAHERPALTSLMKRGGFDEAGLSRYESWAASLLLATVAQSELGLSGAKGVEPVLTAGFRAAGKPVSGLETISDQFGLFDRLPEDVQRRLLIDSIDDAKDSRAQYDRMLRAWLSGNMKAIARDFVAELAPEPALAKPLLTERNRAWAKRIAQLPGRPFVAVGAAHLAGPDNLLVLLQQQGYSIRRIQ